jgi:hypothetical protein
VGRGGDGGAAAGHGVVPAGGALHVVQAALGFRLRLTPRSVSARPLHL